MSNINFNTEGCDDGMLNETFDKSNKKKIQVIEHALFSDADEYYCPNCEEYVTYDDNYCSNCGARLGWDIIDEL